MSAKKKEGRKIVRKLLAEGVVDKNVGKTIARDGEHVHISKEKGTIRFDLIVMQTAFVLMSDRLYRRDFVQPETEPEDSGDQHIQRQLDYHGLAEEVDTRIYSNKLVCACGNVRWVKNADLFQVEKCKPCIYRERKERRRRRRLSK